ncbi:SDR family NAD(P)-dependent oxidoreductase [Glaciibacter flavus]|uniref:3beta-hydroxysteroid 3-dehydrogenase n=1 Tax=Orlajensenia flava TaxID=2565934 RepID=A0A4S4FU04_9MICO|nr:SDR family NAD(P)-dependent oxidoreductase [Glaciibacter flavus]THG34153.1 SDR family NAD(P)-dependent oxidoreductase [Glaciibacter flavus]
MTWDPVDTPSQQGKVFVVTGANAGVGFFTAAQLAIAGARVILACRNDERADAAAEAIRARVPAASVSTLRLDVSDLSSVQAAAVALTELPRLDGVIANAGVVHPPRDREVSLDGNELVFATNYLGHFALVTQLLPALERTPGARVVMLGSIAARLTRSALDDVQLERSYDSWTAYAQSKLEVESFGFELDRRLRAAGSPTSALVAQPGYSVGGMSPSIAGVNEPSAGKRFTDSLQGLWAQGKDRGAWPVVRAAIDPAARGAEYYGPRWLTRGRPVKRRPIRASTDPAIGARLWAESERILAS